MNGAVLNAARARSRSAERGRPRLERALARARASRPAFVAELCDLLRIPSVSAEPERREAVRACAAWLDRHLRALGLRVATVETGNHPLVFAASAPRPGRPTVLIYGHYDVQPAGRAGDWSTPPFAPVIRGENLMCRGASDDKGQLFAHLAAIACWQRVGGPPLNVRFVLEGEEEIGSPGLLARIARAPEWFQADAAIVSDTAMLAPDRPALTCALRGTVQLELEVRGADRALHAGHFGGAVAGPARALCEILAGLHDERGRVRVPGFYDRVLPPDPAERGRLVRTPHEDRSSVQPAEATLRGEQGFTPRERVLLRPAVSVISLAAGTGGTTIPTRASARIDVRLVPDQDPLEVARAFERDLRARAPADVRARVRVRSRARPARIDPRHPIVGIAAEACRGAFGRAPALRRSGGTVPVAAEWLRLGTPTLLLGFGLPDDRTHGPDEKFHLPTFFRAIEASIRLLDGLARVPPRGSRRERASAGTCTGATT